MKKLEGAKRILASLGLPLNQRNERSALTLLALAGLRRRDAWKSADRSLLRIWDMMAFMREHYDKDYAANTRETIRRQTIHQFEQARLVDRNPDDPRRPTNSGKNVYALTENALEVIRAFGTSGFDGVVARFVEQFGSLEAAYRNDRATQRIPLCMPDGSTISLSPGPHNALQVQIIQQFGPRFAKGARILYFGDTARKHIVRDGARLAELGVTITEHDKLPDVLLYQEARNWLYLIEAVTTHGTVSPKRHRELEASLTRCTAERVYVTAFPDAGTFRKYAAGIAWETEVWIADQPDHMIHFNGPKFLGPYPRQPRT